MYSVSRHTTTITETEPSVREWCGRCHGERLHWLRSEFTAKWYEEDRHVGYQMSGEDRYQIIECAGCEYVRFRHEEYWSESGSPEPTVKIYPAEFREDDTPLESFDNARESVHIPDKVLRLYKETLKAYNAEAETLAGGGLRAIVEAICNEQKIGGANLALKIDGLVAGDLLAKPQADLLHAERALGNQALHEGDVPGRQELLDGLRIVSWLISTIYVLPVRAARMRQQSTTNP